MTVRRKLWFVLLAAVPNALVALAWVCMPPLTDLPRTWGPCHGWLAALGCWPQPLCGAPGDTQRAASGSTGAMAGVGGYPGPSLTHLLLWLGPFRSTFPFRPVRDCRASWTS
jgi:hypothetical protein